MSGFDDASAGGSAPARLQASWAVAMDLLESTLLRCRRERFTGLLHLDGNPGGSLWVNDGLVVAAATPAAPGPEPLLLRSGRVAEADWIQAYAAGAISGDLAGELAERRLIGVAGIEVVSLTAVFDAVFAMAVSGAGGCRAEPAGPGELRPLLPVGPGVEPDRVMRETARRLHSASRWLDLGVSLQSRPLPASRAVVPVADQGRRDLLLRANGRRTPRDLAFAVGRGLFPVLKDVASMVNDGLLDVGSPGALDPAAAPGEAQDGALPRRRRGASGVNDVLPAPAVSAPPLIHRLSPVGPDQPQAHEDSP